MTTPAPITAHTADVLREMRKEQAPSIADALKQCRDALHDVAIGCAIEFQNAEARDTVGSRKAVRVANAAANVKTLQDALTAADTALAALSEPQDDGWLQVGPLLYRLTDERRPTNRDEIRVTMANGSCSPESCTARAGELLDAIRQARASLAPAPQPASQGEVPMPEPLFWRSVGGSIWNHKTALRITVLKEASCD